jgi:hypothetical protein
MKESLCGSQVVYWGPWKPPQPAPAGLLRQPILKLLIRHWFDSGPHKHVKFILHCNINDGTGWQRFNWRTFVSILVYLLRVAFALLEKESRNGLESTEDRRSAGWHGNQHVCLRGPQVSGSVKLRSTQVDVRRQHAPSWGVVVLVSTFETLACGKTGSRRS